MMKVLVMTTSTWKSLGSNDHMLVEGYVMLKMIVLAKECGLRQMVFESDSETLIRMVKDKTQSNDLIWKVLSRKSGISSPILTLVILLLHIDQAIRLQILWPI